MDQATAQRLVERRRRHLGSNALEGANESDAVMARRGARNCFWAAGSFLFIAISDLLDHALRNDLGSFRISMICIISSCGIMFLCFGFRMRMAARVLERSPKNH